MALSLSQADQYHISIKADFKPEVKHAELKIHFILPPQLAENSDMFNPQGFYHGLMQKQLITSTTPASIEAIRKNLLTLKQTAYAKAPKNIQRYQIALSHFITDSRILLQSASAEQLCQFDLLIEQFIRLHDNESALCKRRLYSLAHQQIVYAFTQALLRNQQSKHNTCCFKQLISKYQHHAQQQQLKLHHDSEKGRERLLNKLHLGRKVLHAPYKVTQKKLKNGQLAEQVIFGFAAAFAMAFATGVAFATQQAFGNFSTPFFCSLVLSYIFKDRIKELGRNYLMEKFSSKYFQHQCKLQQGNHKTEIATVTESFFRQKIAKLSEKPLLSLKRLPSVDANLKSLWVYQKRYNFSKYKQNNTNEKFRDELTINLSKDLRSLPKILSEHYFQGEQQIGMTTVHKIHHIYVLASYSDSNETKLCCYKIITSRKGIHGIEKIQNHLNKT